MTVIFHVRSQKHRGSAWIGCEICDAFTITNGFKNEKVLKEHCAKIHGKVRPRKLLRSSSVTIYHFS